MICQWFALCRNKATVLIAHPILGKVPTCASCAERPELSSSIKEPIS
jgi:hypothetical protein